MFLFLVLRNYKGADKAQWTYKVMNTFPFLHYECVHQKDIFRKIFRYTLYILKKNNVESGNFYKTKQGCSNFCLIFLVFRCNSLAVFMAFCFPGAKCAISVQCAISAVILNACREPFGWD